LPWVSRQAQREVEEAREKKRGIPVLQVERGNHIALIPLTDFDQETTAEWKVAWILLPNPA
jgi:hypothetical protein